jgi:hypothetical protein
MNIRNETVVERGPAPVVVTSTEPRSLLVTGLFKDRESAERAFNALTHRGYGNSDINLIMSDETRRAHFVGATLGETELGNKAAKGAGVGGTIGGAVGAIAAAIAAVGTSLAIPGLGLIVAGPIVAALAGAGAGGVTGTLVGALIGWGIPEERLKHYEAGIKSGGILLAVNARSEEDAAQIESDWRHTAIHVYR